MKRILTIILITVFLSPLLPAQTDTVPTEPEDPGVSGTWEVVAGGGMSVPFEPEHYNDAFKNGYYFGGGLAYSLPTGDLGYGEISLMLQYYNTPFDEATFIEGNGLGSTANVYGYPGDVFTAMAQFRGVFAGSKETIAPFFTMGLGMFHIALPEMGVFGSAEPLYRKYTKTTFGWSLGAGVDVPVMEMVTLYLDGKFLLGVTETNGHKLFTGGAGVRVKI